ncbi:MAG: MFS transporter [Verrucomicrobiota bacterium]
MSQRQLKAGYFTLEGLNAFATSYYFFYLFFFMEKQFQFSNKENLFLAAVNGFVYMSSAWFGGRFAQKHGYFVSLRLGFTILTLTMALGSFVGTVTGQFMLMMIWTFGMCFTWPTLEALASEKESPAGLQQMIGIYNLVWSGVSALAYFTGGAMLEKLGLRSIFWVPMGLHLLQLGLVSYLERQATTAAENPNPPLVSPVAPPPLNPRPIAKAKTFLRMAWLANPFAYVAINTVVAVIPGLARKFDLSPMLAGFFCSIWFFARLGTFLWLWLWTGWHYRFRWFVSAYLLLIAGFATILLVPRLWMVLLAQVGFGIAVGLIYYSSLFYSMDVGEAKSEHGGLHESALGVGIFAGPAVGASALHFLPNHPQSGAWGVSALLLLGFFGLLGVRLKSRPGKG